MSDEVPSPTARMYSVNRQESPQPDLDLERQSLPHTTDGALDPGDLLEECVASGHGVAGAECACDCPSHEPNYTRADFMDPERIKVLSWQDSVKRNDNVEDAKIVLIQRPDSSTEDTFTHDLGVRGEFFSEHAADTLRDWNITADGTHNWWHIAGSMTPGPLIRFHPGVGEVACSFLPFAATSKEITLAVESFRPAASGDDSIEPDRSIYTAQRAFRMHRCRLIVLSSGQFLPRWERPSRFVVFLYRLKTVEVWITAPFLLPFVLLYIFLKIVWPSAPDFFEIMFRRPKPLGRQRISKSYHETTFENTRWKTEPMLTQVLGMRKQMSLFKFNWNWVSVERHLAILEIIRDFHCRPDAVDSDKRLSEWALSAHLNYFAWNEVVRGIQEESDWLREHAIESPGQELLARLNTCRSLLAKLKKQLSGGRDKNEILGLSWLQAHMVGLEKLDDGVQREEVTVQSHMSDGETTKGATVASMDEQQSNENGGEPQTSDHAQADKEASTLGDLNDEDNLTPLNIDHKYIGIKADLEKLEDEVQETFQLLAISIQIKDTGVARTQARRATALTVIATIYLPATLAVGAFGMNVQYLGGDLSIKWPIILFAALFAPSAIVLLFLFLRE